MTGDKFKNKIQLLILTIIIFQMLTMSSAFANNPQFRLDMDSLNLEKGVSANLVFSMINARGARLIDITGLENFDVLSKSNSTSTQIINGVTSYQENVNYIIMPKSAGEFTLQGNVKYNGTTYRTNELKVNVRQANTSVQGEAKDIFMNTLLANNEVYFGQKVVLTYELFSRYNIESFGFTDAFNLNDFFIKELPDNNSRGNYTYINGNKYVKYDAKQFIITPIKTGTFTIPSYNFQVNVSTGDFFKSSKPVYLKTEPKELTVKPLPQENQPSDFSGIVGKLNLDARYSKQELNYGDSLTLEITAGGSCNLDDMKAVIGDKLPGFSVYQTEKGTNEGIENNQYYVKKVFEVILIPERNGDIKIEPVSISYFNPETGSYERAEIPGTTIKVNGEMPNIRKQEGNASSGPVTETVRISQVSYNSPREGYLTIQLKKNLLITFIVIIFIILTVAAVLLMLFKFQQKKDKVMDELYKQIKNSDNRNEIYNLFNNMMKHRFNISLKASSRQDIVNRLKGQQILAPVLDIMNYMESRRNNSDDGIENLKDKIENFMKSY